MVEVARAHRLPAERMLADGDAAGPIGVGDYPDVGAAVARFVPEHVAGAVAVEVSGAGGLPAARMQPDVDAARPMAIGDLPGLGVAVAWIIPEHVGRAVIV